MKATGIVIVLLSQQGYWFGGQDGTVSIRWTMKDHNPDAVLKWDLYVDEVHLAGDAVAMPKGEQPSTVTLTLPDVRVRTAMRWVYRLYERDGSKELARGEETIHVFPKDLLSGLDKLTEGKKIVVWDSPGALSKVLDKAEIRHTRIERASGLQFERADIILVGPDQIGMEPFEQSTLVNYAQAGAGVLIFLQTRIPRLAGYALVRRPVPAKLEWKMDHLLLSRFQPKISQSWLIGATTDLWAVQLPVDEPALEIGYWPREVQGEESAPIDALLVTKTVQSGRIVLCQIPLGQWETDPRSQLLLANAYHYLSTRPEPTPPPSRRLNAQVVQPEPVPTITIPPGGIP